MSSSKIKLPSTTASQKYRLSQLEYATANQIYLQKKVIMLQCLNFLFGFIKEDVAVETYEKRDEAVQTGMATLAYFSEEKLKAEKAHQTQIEQGIIIKLIQTTTLNKKPHITTDKVVFKRNPFVAVIKHTSSPL